MSDLNATSTLLLNTARMALNGNRPVYDVCPIGIKEIVGVVSLGADDRWYIDGDSTPWLMVADAVRVIMMGLKR